MKDELRRYVNRIPTVAIANLSEPGSPAFFSDYTVPKVGSRVGFSRRDDCQGVWNHETGTVKAFTPATFQWDGMDGETYRQESYEYRILCNDGTELTMSAASVCVERESFLPNSRWMYFFEDDVLGLYENGDSCTKDSWEDILSELGFIVVEDDTLGLFFGCDGEVSEVVWDTLLDIIKDGMRDDTDEPRIGRLVCGKCPRRYYIGELEDTIGRDEISRMIDEKNTILCPACATAAGYGHKEE